MLKKVTRSPRFQSAAGALGAAYLRLVRKTSSFQVDPPDVYERVEPEMPVIIAMWHGQHLMIPFIKRNYHEARVLISRHRDGEINALAAARLGVPAIRGSGDMKGNFHAKGGASAFREMLDTLNSGVTVALTADVPKVSRRAGLGIIRLAMHSQRPVVPIAIATSRRIELDNWDKTAINLPFGRAAAVMGEWVRVPADADRDAQEAARQAVEASLNAATERSYAIVDRRDG